MGSKEFALGAELALRQAGVTDDRMKQQLIAKVTQANLARAQQEMGMQQQQQAGLQEISKMFEPRQEPVSQWEPSFGTRTVTPEVDMNQLAMKLIPHAPAQALQTLTQSQNQQPDFFTKEMFKAGLKPKEPSFYEKENYKASLRKQGGGDEFAPDMQPFENSQTGEIVPINVRDPIAVKSAENNGFQLIGPERRGYGVAIGKANAEREQQVNKEANVARNQIATLKTLDQLLDRFETGKLAKVGMTLQQYANALGLPVNLSQLSDKEAFNAIVQQLALQSRNQGEGMVLAGQMSDRDVQFLRDMNVQLIMTTSGNKKLIKIRSAIAQRQNRIAELMRQYKAQNKGRFDSTGFDSYISNNLDRESIFGIPEGSNLIGTDSKTGLPVYQTPDGKAIIPSF